MPIAAFDLLTGADSMFPPPHTDYCAVRACPYPWLDDGLCFQHLHFFDYKESMTGTMLDPADIWDDEDPFRPVLCVISKDDVIRKEPLVRVVWAGWKPIQRDEQPQSGESWRLAVARAQLDGTPVPVKPPNYSVGRGVGGKGFGHKRNLKCSQRARRKEKLKNKVGGKHGAHDDIKRWDREAVSMPIISAHFEGPKL